MNIKERSEIHAASRYNQILDEAEKVQMSAEKREMSELLWKQVVRMVGQSFKEGAIFTLLEIRAAMDDAPEGSDIGDVVYKRTVELIEGL